MYLPQSIIDRIKGRTLPAPTFQAPVTTPFTEAQVQAIDRLWSRSYDGEPNIFAFRKRFDWHGTDHIGGRWCGMFVGIEKDGYTHT
jgi:hypothetical protein